jgi:hypothetical protein
VPEKPVYLNQYLATDDLTGGETPALGDPAKVQSNPGNISLACRSPGSLSSARAVYSVHLDSLPVDFRFCQQAEIMGREEAKKEHESNRKKWSAKKRPLKAMLPGGELAPVTDNEAMRLEVDANDAKTQVEYGNEVSTKYKAKVVIMGRTLEELSHKASIITTAIEESVASRSVWRRSAPCLSGSDLSLHSTTRTSRSLW